MDIYDNIRTISPLTGSLKRRILAVARILLLHHLAYLAQPAVAEHVLPLPHTQTTTQSSADMAQSVTVLANASQHGNVTGSALDMAAGLASNPLEGWMRQWGTAQVQLNVDDRGRWDRSSVDWLVPVYTTSENILFTQWGFHTPDGRKTANIGLGARTFHGDWLYGVNLFWDNDFTGQNRRVGLGAEAWRDYLKVSANTYFAATGWHTSRDDEDWDERPANGWDLRAEAYLPVYPQLGGKLVYEAYRGNAVALTDSENRHTAPSALTAGLSYTPLPILTADVLHRTGTGSQHETQYSLTFRYQLNTPWHKQLSPEGIRTLRTLEGSRFDLVTRNNNIILDYRKQDVLKLTLPRAIQGTAGESMIIEAEIISKHALDHMRWDASALIAAGGKILQQSERQIQVQLPPNPSTNATPYPLHAVAYDTRGNASNEAETAITVLPPEDILVDGHLTIVNDNAPADGKSTNMVQATVTDKQGNPLAGQTVTFTADHGANLTLTSATTDTQGQARTSLTNTLTGRSVVTATFSNGQRQSVDTTFIPDMTQAQVSMRLLRNNAIKDGVDANEVEATVTDSQGMPIPAARVTFATHTPYSNVVTPDTMTDENGKATTKVVSKYTVSNTVTATLNNGNKADIPVNFTVLKSTYSLKTNHAAANGSDQNIFSITLTHPVTRTPVVGQLVHFKTSDPMTLSGKKVITDASGTASVSMTSTTPTVIGGFTLIVDSISCCTIVQGGINFR